MPFRRPTRSAKGYNTRQGVIHVGCNRTKIVPAPRMEGYYCRRRDEPVELAPIPPPFRDRKFADSLLEGSGFEIPVPGDSVRAEPISSQTASILCDTTIQRMSSESGDRCHS